MNAHSGHQVLDACAAPLARPRQCTRTGPYHRSGHTGVQFLIPPDSPLFEGGGRLTVAKRAGHSVEVLYRVYTRVIHGTDDDAKISARLRRRG